MRVKLWRTDGTVLYSDEPRLVGRTFPLDEGARSSLHPPRTEAGVTDLNAPENRYERAQGKLLDVYRPVWTPSGRPLLFAAPDVVLMDLSLAGSHRRATRGNGARRCAAPLARLRTRPPVAASA